MTVEAFYLAERFRMPITVLADQLITDGFEYISVPENDAEMKEMGFRVWPREIHPGPDFYPSTDEIDIPPVVLGHNTGPFARTGRPRKRAMTSRKWKLTTSTLTGSFTKSAITETFSNTTMTRNSWMMILT